MEIPKNIKEILLKKINSNISLEEEHILATWVEANSTDQKLIEAITKKENLLNDIALYDDLWNNDEAINREKRIQKLVHKQTNVTPGVSLRKLIPYAAVLFIVFTTVLVLYKKPAVQKNEIAVKTEEILPGGNRAILKLEDNTAIDLNDQQTGIKVGKDIAYLDGTAIIENNDKPQNLTLETPTGGNYKVILPDGTKVWLNSNTTLTYPSKFNETERLVKLDGEAYFEVSKQNINGKNIAFKVITNNQTVNVLGTSFNISSYQDEKTAKTTLLTGAVEIENSFTAVKNKLKPGQQARITARKYQIEYVDINKVIAWKNGQFSFDDKSFEEIMREMSRWYNFKIVYEGAVPDEKFIGNAYKTEKLSTVLNFLESATLSYKMQKSANGTHTLIINNKKGGNAE